MCQTDPVQSGTSLNGRLRVCLLDLWSYIPYYITALCAALQANGVDTTLASVRYHLDRDYFRKCGLLNHPGLMDLAGAIRTPCLRRVLKFPEYLMNMAALAGRFQRAKPDILHIQFMPLLQKELPFELWFMNFAKRLGIPIVYTVHNVNLQALLEAKHTRGHSFGLAYRAADALICHGQAAKEHLTHDFSIPEEKVWVIAHGPLFNDYVHVGKKKARLKLRLSTTDTLVLFQGVISPYKGVDFLLQAWPKVQERQPHARLVIAGTGDRRFLEQIRKQVQTLRIQQSVDLHLRFIPVEELPLFYQAADILVYPYKSGTSSGALMTGLGYGKPIIATTIPLFQEMLRPRLHSELVQYGDSDALANSLLHCVNNLVKYNCLEQEVGGSSDASNSWNLIAKHTLTCYTAVLKSEANRFQHDRDEGLPSHLS